MSDGNREEACEALADENGAGGSEEKKTFMSPFFFHDLRMNYSCCGKDLDGVNLISTLFLDLEFHSSVIA